MNVFNPLSLLRVETWSLPLADWTNDALDWLIEHHGYLFDGLSEAVLAALIPLDQALRSVPWWLMLTLIGGLAFAASRRWQTTLGVMLAFGFAKAVGLWDESMQTLSLMVFATSMALLAGFPIGLLISKSPMARRIVMPILDAAQTLPSFVYLVPAIMLFGLGKVPALLATWIYATPPMIRLTDLGLRLVDRKTVEAAQCFGAPWYRQIWDIQIPLAIPNIMAGINQATMMALSMVVIASMIGARGLGEEVLLGIQRLDVGRGLEAGLAIVFMAIAMDRTTQAYAKRTSKVF